MFRTININENLVGIPCHGSDDYRWLIWNEDECVDDVLTRHSRNKSHYSCWTSFHVWPEGKNSGEYSDTEIRVYEMECCKTGILYFLLVYPTLVEFDSLYHSVAIPFNALNLLDFFKTYLIPLAGKPYINGD